MKPATKATAVILRTEAAIWESDMDAIRAGRQDLATMWDSLSPTEQGQLQELSVLLFNFRQKVDPVDPSTVPLRGRAVVFLDGEKEDPKK